jgi:hypothetical protein
VRRTTGRAWSVLVMNAPSVNVDVAIAPLVARATPIDAPAFDAVR